MYAKKTPRRRMPAIALAIVMTTAVAAGFAILEWRGTTNILESVGVAGAKPEIGAEIDSFNGIAVYYNGPIGNVSGRTLGADGYNIGQKYQCVEFVKRYYYEALKHKMPDPWGHAKSFFDSALKDGEFNKARGLIQYANGGAGKPEAGDLMVFGGIGYGHVAIVSEVGSGHIEIIQQNPGPYAPSRERLPLSSKTVTLEENGALLKRAVWKVGGRTPMGWLRKGQ